MRKQIIDLRDEKPLLDVAAFARKGRLPTPAERLHISLTVYRAPEVMVKVSGGARTLSGVERHMAYIGREGELGLDLDADGHIGGKGFERGLVRDWDLDVDALQNHAKNSGATKKPPKLVHNIIFSMPPGTSPRAVLRAVHKLAVNEWALEHRYAMVLHTDDDHPHVHVVLKSVSEQGVRLNIRKATLRSWRAQFAANLRELGVDANATERAVRGQIKAPKTDGVYRASLRSQSSYILRKRHQASRVLSRHELDDESSRSVLDSTRKSVVSGWRILSQILHSSGDHELAGQIHGFYSSMPPVRTDAQGNRQQETEKPREQKSFSVRDRDD